MVELRPKTTIVFWTAVAAATFLLGGSVASVEALVDHPTAWNGIVLALSLIGFLGACTVAGRIVFVVGREQRRSLREAGPSLARPVRPRAGEQAR